MIYDRLFMVPKVYFKLQLYKQTVDNHYKSTINSLIVSYAFVDKIFDHEFQRICHFFSIDQYSILIVPHIHSFNQHLLNIFD